MFGALLGGLLGLVGTGIMASSQSRQQKSNNDLQRESLDLQKDQFAYQKQFDQWSQSLAEKQFNLASSPVSSVVSDASKVGVNPMAALGQSAGSSTIPSSNANTGFGAGSVPLMDTGLSSILSMLSSVITTGMNNKTEKRIADQNFALKQQELGIIEENNLANIGLGSERNEIARFESNIHQQLANANDKMTALEFQKFAHNKIKDIKTYLLDKARFEYSKNFSDKEFAQKVTEFNKKFDEQVREFNENVKTSDKDRRERYITSFVSDATKLIGDIFFASQGR